jgi:hypothetical protein
LVSLKNELGNEIFVFSWTIMSKAYTWTFSV